MRCLINQERLTCSRNRAHLIVARPPARLPSGLRKRLEVGITPTGMESSPILAERLMNSYRG